MSFNVLDPDLIVRQSRLIEASAGTGKTFAIQHLVIRFILNDPFIPFNRLAVITFTRKATQSLKDRLRVTLQQACAQIRSQKIEWAYLQAVVEKKGYDLVLKRLLEALFHFDQIQVSTIHAFAYHLLQQSSLYQGQALPEDQAQGDYLLQLIQAYLKVLSKKAQVESGLLELVRDGYHWDLERLAQDLATALQKGLKIGIRDLVDQSLNELLPLLKHSDSKNVPLWATEYASDFKGACNREGQLHFEFSLGLKAWKASVDLQQWIDLDRLIDIIDLFQTKNLKRHKSNLLSEYFQIWQPYLQQLKASKSKKNRLEALAQRLAKSLDNILQEDVRIGFDVVLKKLVKQLDNEKLAYQMAQELDVIIVDEFQDTDPLQWQILKSLYQFNSQLCLVLVGDPKQSIYAFRQADIYTYLEAKSLLTIAGHQSAVERLSINYRSHPKLVEGLNHLFDSRFLTHWLALPRINSALDCPAVKSGRNIQEDKLRKNEYEDSQAPKNNHEGLPEKIEPQDDSSQSARIEFFKLVRTKSDQIKQAGYFIAQALLRPWIQTFSSFAALVNDHQSAFSLQTELAHFGVASQIQRPVPFAKLISSHLYYLALEAWSQPNQDEKMKAFWSNPLFGLTQLELVNLFDITSQKTATFWQQTQYLNRLLLKQGLEIFHEQWLDTLIPYSKQTLKEFLEQMESGRKMLHEWSSLVSWLSQKADSLDSKRQAPVDLLKRLLDAQFNDEALYAEPLQPNHLQIMTIHASKGLEFDVVFSLGTVSESFIEGGWMQTFIDGEQRLVSYESAESDEYYLKACDEQDAEKARRLYVSWTRAKEYLFIAMPDLDLKKRGSYKRGLGSCMDLYMVSWNPREAGNHEKGHFEQLYEDMNHGRWDAFKEHMLEWQQKGLVVAKEPLNQTLDLYNSLKKNDEPIELVTLDLAQRLKEFSPPTSRISFTSLAQKSEQEQKSIALLESADSDATLMQPQDSIENLMAKDLMDQTPISLLTLPRGRQTGIVWHSLMQQVALFAKTQAPSSLWPDLLKSWSLVALPVSYQPWIELMSRQACTLFTQTWFIQNHRLCLAELKSDQLWPEKAFTLSDAMVKKYLLEHVQGLDNTWLHGVIDLIAVDDSKVYFIDWKSNWLGPNLEDYQLEKIIDNALKNNYDLQASIYAKSIQNYLDQFCEGKATLIGGIYIYLRCQTALIWDTKLQQFSAQSLDEGHDE